MSVAQPGAGCPVALDKALPVTEASCLCYSGCRRSLNPSVSPSCVGVCVHPVLYPRHPTLVLWNPKLPWSPSTFPRNPLRLLPGESLAVSAYSMALTLNRLSRPALTCLFPLPRGPLGLLHKPGPRTRVFFVLSAIGHMVPPLSAPQHCWLDFHYFPLPQRLWHQNAKLPAHSTCCQAREGRKGGRKG